MERIGSIARDLGVSPDWIRRLEREGRIPRVRRDLNGHRRFDAETVEQIRALLFKNRKEKNG